MGKTLSIGKTRSIKEYFESLTNKDKKIDVNRVEVVENKVFDKEATKKVGVRGKIETFETLFCVTTGGTPQKTPVKRLKRLEAPKR